MSLLPADHILLGAQSVRQTLEPAAHKSPGIKWFPHLTPFAYLISTLCEKQHALWIFIHIFVHCGFPGFPIAKFKVTSLLRQAPTSEKPSIRF